MPRPAKTPLNADGSAWLTPALDYVADWLAFQLERQRQVGCTVAIARDGELVAEFAFGRADLRTSRAMTPRHRMRIASHSKSFTAAAVMLLREQGRVGLDDPIGRHVSGLHRDLAGARVAELLSHGAGVVRDGADSGQFFDRRPFLSRHELREELARAQPLSPGLQLKYSNHGYGLLGLMIEQITGDDYSSWVMRHVIRASGLAETAPDMPALAARAPRASGHSMEFPYGRRLVIPGDNACHAIAPAGGFVSTAADTARFFSSLGPDAHDSILSTASRRAMAQRRWRDPHSAQESHYGFGTMLSGPGPKEWAGHTGSLQGFISRTSRFSASGLTITVLTNSVDGLAYPWVDGIASILDTFRQRGAPAARLKAWRGRWWTLWGATDLVPVGDRVLHVAPAMLAPFDGFNTECEIDSPRRGRIAKTSAYASPGEGVRRVLDDQGRATQLWMGGTRFVSREELVAEATKRYR